MQNAITPFLICSLVAAFASAQNWAPLNMADKYNYQLEGAETITNTISVDSTEVIGGDSIFYLNRIVVECDTCAPNTSWPCGTFLMNQGQFLQKKMVKDGDGAYHFEGWHNFTILTGAGLGDSWVFDAENNTLATVTALAQESVLGQPDSTKTITLSNGKDFKMSKGHGILQFPKMDTSAYYELVGIGGRNLGELVPDFWTIYDFQTGDVFQIEDSYTIRWAVVQHGWVTNLKITKNKILDKQAGGDSIVYTVQRLTTKIRRSYSTVTQKVELDTTALGADTVAWVFRDTSVAVNGYPEMMVIWDGYSMFNSSPLHLEPKLHKISITKDSNDVVTKSELSLDTSYTFCGYFPSDINAGSDVIYSVAGGVRAHVEYKEHLGRTYLYGEFLDDKVSIHLTGYQTQWGSGGSLRPDAFFFPADTTQVDTVPGKIALLAFPNPLPENVEIEFDQKTGEALEVEVVNQMGQTIMEKTVAAGAKSFSLDFQDSAKGLLFLRVKGKHTSIVEKVFRN